ncbi:MAG TPA: H-X9-DG-CTERM domain-containing protein [Pirellulales bacterium]|nr:H-X9-DG-CTERM domain-containing protein [Pirellulales bacterium]
MGSTSPPTKTAVWTIFSSRHVDGINCVFADGSVHFIPSIVTDGEVRRNFWAMGTRKGNEIISWQPD